jgi:hypothetical protein
MQIRWSLPAAEDLERIGAWIEQDNPEQRGALPKSSMRVAASSKIDWLCHPSQRLCLCTDRRCGACATALLVALPYFGEIEGKALDGAAAA